MFVFLPVVMDVICVHVRNMCACPYFTMFACLHFTMFNFSKCFFFVDDKKKVLVKENNPYNS